jgi:hypothetical protein
MEGNGIYTHLDGRKYEGPYLNDKRHGIGMETFPGASTRIGKWEEGKFIK